MRGNLRYVTIIFDAYLKFRRKEATTLPHTLLEFVSRVDSSKAMKKRRFKAQTSLDEEKQQRMVDLLRAAMASNNDDQQETKRTQQDEKPYSYLHDEQSSQAKILKLQENLEKLKRERSTLYSKLKGVINEEAQVKLQKEHEENKHVSQASHDYLTNKSRPSASSIMYKRPNG